MHACLAALAMLLSGQVESGRYDDAPAADAKPMFQYTDEAAAPMAAGPSGEHAADGTTPQPTPQPTLPGDFSSELRTPGEPVEYSSPDHSPVTPTTDSASDQVAGTPNVRPRDLMALLMQGPDNGGELTGRPVSLADAVATADSRQAQTHLAAAYWDLGAAVADYFLALQEAAELSSLNATIAAPGAAWQNAEAKHQLRANTALRTAQAAQTRLQGLMRAAAGDALPLPADLPHAGRYDSRYDEIFASHDNAVAKQLNDLLPVEYRNISNLATAVAEADQWLSLVSARRSPDTTGEGLLRAHELLSLRRREFIDAVRHYNHHIAEYSELATPGHVETRRLVAMLIKTSTASTPQWQDPDVRRASAYEPELADDGAPGAAAAKLAPAQPSYAPQQPAGSDPAAAAGFAEADAEPTRVRRPVIEVLRNREHSILRRPLSRFRGERR